MASLRNPLTEARARALAARLFPWYGRVAFAAAGLAGGLYGGLAGFLLGAMIDEARIERRLHRFLQAPLKPIPFEPVPGMAAAAALALHADWDGMPDLAGRGRLFETLAFASLAADAAIGGAGAARDGTAVASATRAGAAAAGASVAMARRSRQAWVRRCVAAATAVQGPDLPGLSRLLAAEEPKTARTLLADFAWSLAARRGDSIDHGRAGTITTLLADAGLDGLTIGEARRALFPAYADPWEILGVRADSSRAEIRKAWKRRSKELHPDSAVKNGGAGDFRRLRDAYAFLTERRSDAEGTGEAPGDRGA